MSLSRLDADCMSTLYDIPGKAWQDLPSRLIGLSGSGIRDMIKWDMSRFHYYVSAQQHLSCCFVYLLAFDQMIIHCLAFRAQRCVALLCSHESCM